MKFHFVFTLIFVLILSNCTERPSKPKPFLSEKQMVRLLTELHLTEAALQDMPNRRRCFDTAQLYTVAAYNELFGKFGLDQESYEANLNYRLHYSRGFERIYTKVHNNLQRIDEQNKANENSEDE